TLGPPGLFAMSYGLVALFVTSVGQIVYRDHPLTHFLATLLGGLMTAAVLLLQATLHPPRLNASELATSAVYSAILAPIVLGLLSRMKRAFAVESPRRRG